MTQKCCRCCRRVKDWCPLIPCTRHRPGKGQEIKGLLTILGTCFVFSGLLHKLEQWGSWPLHGGKSRVTEQYGVFAPCHRKEENGHIMSPLEWWQHSAHPRDWLFGWEGSFFNHRQCHGGEGPAYPLHSEGRAEGSRASCLWVLKSAQNTDAHKCHH